MSYKTKKGQNVRLQFNGLYVAAEQGCSIKKDVATESTSSKDDTDNWDKDEETGKSWTADGNSLYAVDTTKSAEASYAELSLLLGKLVRVQHCITSGDQNRVSDTVVESGWARLISLSMDANNKQNGTMSYSLKGYGPIYPGDTAPETSPEEE